MQLHGFVERSIGFQNNVVVAGRGLVSCIDRQTDGHLLMAVVVSVTDCDG